MDNWKFKPCPFCGSEDIGVKEKTITHISEKDAPTVARTKIWAYCRYCEATSGYTIQDIIGDDEKIAAAIEKWNQRKG